MPFPAIPRASLLPSGMSSVKMQCATIYKFRPTLTFRAPLRGDVGAALAEAIRSAGAGLREAGEPCQRFIIPTNSL